MARSRISGNIKLIDNDRGWKALESRLTHGLNGLSIRAGVQGALANEAYDDSGITVAEVAAIQEFGDPGSNIPARPFLGTAFESKNAWRRNIAAAGRNVVDGANPRAEMERVAEQIVRDIQQVLDTANRRFQPLAPSTVKRKGSSDVLYETGKLRAAISATVSKRGK